MTATDLNEIDYIPVSHLDERYMSTDTLHNICWPLKRESDNNRICVSVTVHDCIETKVDLVSQCQQHRRPIGGQSERFYVICCQYHRSDTSRKGWKNRQKLILVSSDVVSEHKFWWTMAKAPEWWKQGFKNRGPIILPLWGHEVHWSYFTIFTNSCKQSMEGWDSFNLAKTFDYLSKSLINKEVPPRVQRWIIPWSCGPV